MSTSSIFRTFGLLACIGGCIVFVSAIFLLATENYKRASEERPSYPAYESATVSVSRAVVEVERCANPEKKDCGDPKTLGNAEPLPGETGVSSVATASETALAGIRIQALDLIVSAIVAAVSVCAVLLAARAASDAARAVDNTARVDRAYLELVLPPAFGPEDGLGQGVLRNGGNSPSRDVLTAFLTDTAEIANVMAGGVLPRGSLRRLAVLIDRGGKVGIALTTSHTPGLLYVSSLDVFGLRRDEWWLIGKRGGGAWIEVEHGECRDASH